MQLVLEAIHFVNIGLACLYGMFFTDINQGKLAFSLV